MLEVALHQLHTCGVVGMPQAGRISPRFSHLSVCGVWCVVPVTYIVARPQKSTLSYKHFQISLEAARVHNNREEVGATYDRMGTLRAVIREHECTMHEPSSRVSGTE